MMTHRRKAQVLSLRASVARVRESEAPGRSFASLMFVAIVLAAFSSTLLSVDSAQAASDDDSAYRLPTPTESEFDNVRESGAPPPRPQVASGEQAYEDTEFGDYLYSETSLATKLEMLRLLSKQTPPTQVFLHAISMGVGVEEMLRASANYAPGKARELAVAAVSVLPLVDKTPAYNYSGYELDDLERRRDANGNDDAEPIYLVSDVINRFFEDRTVLRPQPDWFEGQIHFAASAQELAALVRESSEIAWYERPELAMKRLSPDRPVFVSLYEGDKTVRVDGRARVLRAANNPSAKLPVVFIFNRVNEIALDQLGESEYPSTIRGVRDAYVEDTLMLTPVPEWDLGEHHIQAQLQELDELFDLPREDDFEPEYWQKLLAAARQYSVPDTSFLIVVLPNANRDEPEDDENNESYSIEFTADPSAAHASWDNPRSEETYPFVEPGSNDKDENNRSRRAGDSSYSADGLVLNRPDLVAALLHLQDELNIQAVPVAFYYVDSARVKSFLRGPRALTTFVDGIIGKPPGGGNGGFGPPPENPPDCASPPCAIN